MNSVGGVIGLPITNHFSRITNHGRTSGPAVRFQDLLLAFSRHFAFGVWHFVLPPSPSLRRGKLSSSSGSGY